MNDPALLDDLLAYLTARPDAVVSEAAPDELDVSLLGSYSHDGMRSELYLRIRRWEGRGSGSADFAEVCELATAAETVAPVAPGE